MNNNDNHKSSNEFHVSKTATSIKDEFFRSKNLEDRKDRFFKLCQKNPNKIPVVFERHPSSKLKCFPDIKFMTNRNIQLSFFAQQIRNVLKLSPESAMFFSTIGGIMIKHDSLMGELYDKGQDTNDGFLYIQFKEVESFG